MDPLSAYLSFRQILLQFFTESKNLLASAPSILPPNSFVIEAESLRFGPFSSTFHRVPLPHRLNKFTQQILKNTLVPETLNKSNTRIQSQISQTEQDIFLHKFQTWLSIDDISDSITRFSQLQIFSEILTNIILILLDILVSFKTKFHQLYPHDIQKSILQELDFLQCVTVDISRYCSKILSGPMETSSSQEQVSLFIDQITTILSENILFDHPLSSTQSLQLEFLEIFVPQSFCTDSGLSNDTSYFETRYPRFCHYLLNPKSPKK